MFASIMLHFHHLIAKNGKLCMMLNNGGWDLSAWDHSNGIFILLLRLGSIHSFAFSFTGYYQLRKFLGAS